MQKNWTDRAVDLSLLIDQIAEFFKEKDFNAIKGTTENGYQIFAEDSKYYKIDGCATAAIEGKPENFSITIEQSREKNSRGFQPTIMFTTLFGGGYFLSKRLKADEEWLKFKRDFWQYADKAVASLTGSSNLPKKEQ